MRIFKLYSLLFLTGLLIQKEACTQAVSSHQGRDIFNSRLRLTATDRLGRSFGPASARKAGNKTVGVFYSLWLGQHRSGQKGIYDIQKLLNKNPAALKDTLGRPESPMRQFHFWGEPLYGYYSMSDPWVVTRHMELLSNAGVDYLCIDATNNVVYKESTENLLNILRQFMDQGYAIPKVVFYTNSYSGTTVDQLYQQFYQSGTYDSLWFRPEGKPMIIGITHNNNRASDMTKYNDFKDYIKPAMEKYFDVRESEWPNGDYNPAAIPWMSWQYPQWNHSGTVAVPVAQHSHTAIAASLMHPESSRGYNNKTKKVEKNWMAGANFQTMWDAVFESDVQVNNVLVTSFNEWMAIKYANEFGLKGVFFVDVYNHEFSRDIEMMKGGYADNFYLQLVRNIRRFKLEEQPTAERPPVPPRRKFRRTSDEVWDRYAITYTDPAGDALIRNFSNASGTEIYTDSSARNDITRIQVMHDKKRLYFRIRTQGAVTPYNGTDRNWMNIMIRTRAKGPSFEGYQYVLNRMPTQKHSSVERSLGGYKWTKTGTANYRIAGNLLEISVKLKDLGMQPGQVFFEFKVADHVTKYNDIMDYYVSGDSAPIGRLNYSY
ncbi:hypothetical protein GCM10027051_33470 [Niabella terrae]